MSNATLAQSKPCVPQLIPHNDAKRGLRNYKKRGLKTGKTSEDIDKFGVKCKKQTKNGTTLTQLVAASLPSFATQKPNLLLKPSVKRDAVVTTIKNLVFHH